MKRFSIRVIVVSAIMMGLSGLFADTSFSWVILHQLEDGKQGDHKQAHAKGKTAHYKCPACSNTFKKDGTAKGNATCPKCSKKVTVDHAFTSFSCSNCNQQNTVDKPIAVVLCSKCSFLIIDFVY